MATRVDAWEDVAPLASRVLLDEHRDVLENGSGIVPEIIEARGYYSLDKHQVTHLVQLEIVHPVALRAESWMAIPIWRPDQNKHGEVLRLFGGESDRFKYIWPTGLRLCLDVNPTNWDDLLDPTVPVLITEGIKKSDAVLSAARREGMKLVVLAANGCWGWKTKVDKTGGTIASPDFLDLIWEDRRVYVNSDSDYRTNPGVAAGWNDCATYLSSKTGEHRTFLVVTPPSGLAKQGADDWLASGKSLDALLEHASSPERALLDQPLQHPPLQITSGRKLISEAGTSIPHMVAPLIPERSITLVAGHSGTYKTWNMLGLALDGAFNLPWLGHPGLVMEHGPFSTLYINKEMSGIILGQRLKTLALNDRYRLVPDYEEIIDERLHFVHEADLNLTDEAQRDRLEEAIMLSGSRMVVLDSLSMSWHGNENDAGEVGEFYAQLRGMIERTGCCFAILHHLLKPPGGRQPKNPVVSQFAIRGSGQLYQQADACLMLGLYTTSGAIETDEERLLTVHHVKARTSRELPSWVVKFSSNDGLFQSMEYLCLLMEAKAQVYTASGGDATKLQEWIAEACLTLPPMLPGPGNPGLRTKQLFLLLQQAWSIPDRKPPSEATLYRAIDKLVEQKRLVMVEENKRMGNLYRLSEDDPHEPEDPEVAPAPKT